MAPPHCFWQGSQSREAAVPSDHSASSRYESETRIVVGSPIQNSSSGSPPDLGNWEDCCVPLDMWHRDRRCKIGAAAVRVSKLPARGHTTPHLSRIPNSPYPHTVSPTLQRANPRKHMTSILYWNEVDISNSRCGKLETELLSMKRSTHKRSTTWFSSDHAEEAS